MAHMFTRYRSYEDIPVFTVAAYVCQYIYPKMGPILGYTDNHGSYRILGAECVGFVLVSG